MLDSARLHNPWGKELILLDSIDSTNNYAKALARQGAPHGTVLLAEAQTGGKGRLGRSFSSPASLGLYASVIFRYPAAPDALLHLTPMAAEAVRRALIQSTGLSPQIKWINDLLLSQKKLCGILTELGTGSTGLEYVVLGIGINCNQQIDDFPPVLQSTAISLAQALGHCVEREDVLCALLFHLEKMSRDVLNSPASWLADYRSHCLTLGQDVRLIRGDEVRLAHADDIDDHGALLVTLPDGSREAVSSGEVSVRGQTGYL